MVPFETEPLRRFGWDFRIGFQGREVATLAIARIRDRGAFTLDGAHHTIVAEGFLQRTWRMERGGIVVARAQARGALRPTFEITTGGRILVLRRHGFLGSRWTVEHGRTALGAIRRPSVFRSRAEGELDDRLDPASRIFLIFLTLVYWRRRARRSG